MSLGGFILRGESGITCRKVSPSVALPMTYSIKPALRTEPVFPDNKSVCIALMRVPV
jgi:hypothetical protein